MKQTKRMKGIDRATLEWLVEFLRPFRDMTTRLEGNNYPTLPLVVLASQELREHCLPQAKDTPAQISLRFRASALLVLKLRPTMKQKLTTFLCPGYRTLAMLSDDAERNQVKRRTFFFFFLNIFAVISF